MRQALRQFAGQLLRVTGFGLFPVRVRSGIAAGARWTLYPWTSYWRGTHEPELQRRLLSLGDGNITGWVCWDLGAHFGLYSIGLALRVGPTGEVAAFEPNPVSFRRLEHHRAMNRLGWLKLFQAAASDDDQGSELYTYGDLGSTTTHLPYDGEPRLAHAVPLKVRTMRLDDAVRDGKLRSPNFVKIDVEGHGHRALSGMGQTLRAFRPLLLVGFHCREELEGVMDLLRPLDYTFRFIGSAQQMDEPSVGGDYLFIPRPGPKLV